MIYSDNENKLWWDRIANATKSALLDHIEEKAYSATVLAIVTKVKAQWKDGLPIEPAHLAVLRKWAK